MKAINSLAGNGPVLTLYYCVILSNIDVLPHRVAELHSQLFSGNCWLVPVPRFVEGLILRKSNYTVTGLLDYLTRQNGRPHSYHLLP